MTDFAAVLKAGYVFQEAQRTADYAHTYLAVTSAHGPSQQLINFVNMDGKLGEELGLESYDKFTLNTQHEVLESKLKVDELDAIALEGFGDFLKKYRRWLLVGAAASFFLLPSPITGVLLIGSVTGFILKGIDSQVITATSFKKAHSALERGIAILKKIESATPTSTDAAAWAAFERKVEALGEFDAGDEMEEARDLEPLQKAGWTAAGIITAAKSFNDAGEEVSKLFEAYNKKLEAADKFITAGAGDAKKADTMKAMGSAMNKASHAFHEVSNFTKSLRKDVTHLCACVEKKK